MKTEILLLSLLSAAWCAEAAPLALQGRIDAASAAGGGRVVVPKGVWQTGKIHLKSGVELHLEDGAVLEFSSNPADYLPMVPTSWQGEEMMNLSPLVYAACATNVALTGRGTLRTAMEPWKAWMKENAARRRPQFIQFYRCANVRLEDVAVRGTPFWTIHLYRTDGACVKGVNVSSLDEAGKTITNSDGIDVECSRQVTIRDCTFRQGDDAIVLKSGRDADGIRRGIPTENVTVENCTVDEGHALLAVGSEVGGGIRNVTLRNCRVNGAVNNLVFFKTNAKRGGFMRNITVDGVTAGTVREAVVCLSANYWYTPKPGTPGLRRTVIEDLAVRNVTVKEAARVLFLCGDSAQPAKRIAIEGVNVAKVTRKAFETMNVTGLKIGDIRLDAAPVVKEPPHLGGQEPDPPPSAEDAFAARVKADLFAPIAKGGEKATWNATLAEVARLDQAADARWAACRTPADVAVLQGELKAKMTVAIGGFPVRCSLNAVVTDVIPRDGYRIEKVYFESQPKFYETGLFYRPEGPGPFPTVAITCGHSGNGKGARDYQRACVQAVKAGLAAFIYDPVDQGERIQLAGDGGNVHGHNRIGIRSALLGWSMARWRVWDAMRALDYLASRPDVDANRLGLMGNSGGGTLTSLTMALDPRIRAAAPSCYLSTLRDVCTDAGPQDAEQNLFGQLAFGLNHLGYVTLRAPLPTLMVCKEKDFFPYRGSRATAAIAREVYRAAGAPDAYALFAAPGGHGWVESTRAASVAWMRRWLAGDAAAYGETRVPEFLAKDKGFELYKTDCGLFPGFEVAPKGNVRNLSGAVTAYDLLRGEAARQAAARPALTPERVRDIAGIRPVAVARPVVGSPVRRDGYTAAPWRMTTADGLTLTAVALAPEGPAKGRPVLILPSAGRAQAAARAAAALKAGRAVLVADLRGFGETGQGGRRFYGSDYPEEGVAAMDYLLGRNLVALRAEDAILFARAWAEARGATQVDAVSIGRAAIPLAHAAAVEKGLFAGRTCDERPLPWRAWFETDRLTVHYADLVQGAYRAYDWTDL